MPDQLGERLERLPPGHPSSSYDADGTLREPVPRLHDLDAYTEDADTDIDASGPADQTSAGDTNFPLSDVEWAERYTEVRAVT